mgnify:CR=1 FL=1
MRGLNGQRRLEQRGRGRPTEETGGGDDTAQQTEADDEEADEKVIQVRSTNNTAGVIRGILREQL